MSRERGENDIKIDGQDILRDLEAWMPEFRFFFLYINFPPMFLGSRSGFNITRDLNSGGGIEGFNQIMRL